jgi:hypothetical protein
LWATSSSPSTPAASQPIDVVQRDRVAQVREALLGGVARDVVR